MYSSTIREGGNIYSTISVASSLPSSRLRNGYLDRPVPDRPLLFGTSRLQLASSPINQHDSAGNAPLHNAIERGQIDMVERLLQQGADPNLLTKHGSMKYTPLHLAITNGQLEILEILLSTPGIDVNKPDHLGDTPLIAAVINRRADMVQHLVAARGIDVNAAGFDDVTPLFIAADEDRPAAAMHLLNSPYINVHKAAQGWTPLHRAIARGNNHIVNCIVAKSSKRELEQEYQGRKALPLSKEYGNEEATSMLHKKLGFMSRFQ